MRGYPDIWLHVDAAWAGVTLVCPEYRDYGQLAAINEHADSFCMNFHKASLDRSLEIKTKLIGSGMQWGLVNFDASTLWVRDRKHLTNALDITPEFLRTKQSEEGGRQLYPRLSSRSRADGT